MKARETIDCRKSCCCSSCGGGASQWWRSKGKSGFILTVSIHLARSASHTAAAAAAIRLIRVQNPPDHFYLISFFTVAPAAAAAASVGGVGGGGVRRPVIIRRRRRHPVSISVTWRRLSRRKHGPGPTMRRCRSDVGVCRRTRVGAPGWLEMQDRNLMDQIAQIWKLDAGQSPMLARPAAPLATGMMKISSVDKTHKDRLPLEGSKN